MPFHRHRQRLFHILIGLVIGSIASSLVWAASGGSTDVRIGARVLEDGRVEVALQQQLAQYEHDDGTIEREWGPLLRPAARFVATDAVPNRWYSSSVLTIEVDEPAPPAATDIGPYEIAGTPTGNRPFNDQTLFCVVTHGTPGDFFWFQVYSAFADAAQWNDIGLRGEMHEHATDQALAIDRCVDDGAAAIATTLADAEALAGSLQRATQAGVRVVTFNSGADRATSVGSSVHVALDEVAVGRMAAEEFSNRGVSGDLLCLLHEP
ncbi:MAG: substrate-binding domain-containing protein, partial [Chloroflexi bacterium]|nr:substrate-binding domain-containing protein [Chloroflexota bacterium]